ncbi:MAG: GlsB/YeaQ/YmgE family stress response membrane protein [Actinobacteria bacterium]|nr:GlsB/YeaQ/YmgE family stress response membrane protein [Actinomycetota bacterium]
MWFLITFLIVGFIAGLVARALVSGPSPRGFAKTTLLGMAGSLVGGFFGYVVFGKDVGDGAFQASGLLGSTFGAILLLLAYRRWAET